MPSSTQRNEQPGEEQSSVLVGCELARTTVLSTSSWRSIGQPQLHRDLQHGVPNTLCSPMPEPDIDRVPVAIALMHISPRGTFSREMHQLSKAGRTKRPRSGGNDGPISAHS